MEDIFEKENKIINIKENQSVQPEETIKENTEVEEDAAESIYQDTLENMIKIAKDFQERKIDKAKLDNYTSTLMVRSYLPILSKTKVVSLILLKLFSDPLYTLELKMAKLYMDMFFYGMLAEYCFIDCSNTELITFDNYDLLYSVFGAYILGQCKEDYDMFNHFFWDNLGLYNIQEIGTALEKIDVTALKQDTFANKKILDEFAKNEALIKSLNDIAALLDPNVTDVADLMKQEAIGETKKKKS